MEEQRKMSEEMITDHLPEWKKDKITKINNIFYVQRIHCSKKYMHISDEKNILKSTEKKVRLLTKAVKLDYIA